jgi:hypothetical protein
MTTPIQLEIIESQPVSQPLERPIIARSQINSEQVQALIALIASANPPLIVLPEEKEFSDIKGFNIAVLPDNKGIIKVGF